MVATSERARERVRVGEVTLDGAADRTYQNLMPQRDEMIALQSRLEAQARELEEAKSKLSLVRAAHARERSANERLRRALEEREGAGEGEARSAPPGRPTFLRALPFLMAGMLLFYPIWALSVLARGASASPPVTEPASTTVHPLLREGRVVRTVGPQVVALGEQCRVTRDPVQAGSFDCRVEVRCGEQTLYGATPDTGYMRCRGQEVAIDAHTSDRDGDPAMTLDLARGIATVEERVGMGVQRVEIALDPELPVAPASSHLALLRMSGPVTSLEGTPREGGFTITIPDVLALDPASSLPVAHPDVERASVENRGDHAVLDVDFAPGRSPEYRVVGRGDAVEVSIGR